MLFCQPLYLCFVTGFAKLYWVGVIIFIWEHVTEAQRGEVICLKVHSASVEEWGLPTSLPFASSRLAQLHSTRVPELMA